MADPKIVLTAEDKTKAAFESVKSGLTGIQTKAVAVTGALAALGVTAWAAGMAHDIANVAEEWDELGKAAQRAGFESAQGMAEFQFAAKLSGVDAGGFEAAVGKLNAKMADAASGSKEAAATFAAMGVKFKGANGELRASEEVLKDLADKFASYKDGPEKTALAMDLFGKAGRDLIPLLNGGAAGLEKLREEFRKLRGQITDEDVKAAETFNDNLSKLEAAVGSLARKLTSSLLEALVQVTEKMVEAAKQGGLLRGILAGISEGAAIATNTDELGQAKLRVRRADERISHYGTQIDVQEAILARDPKNDVAQRRLESLRTQLQAVQKEAQDATAALKYLVNPKFDLTGSTGDFARADRSGAKGAAPVVAKPDTGAQSAYDAIIKRIQERLAGQTAELEKGRALTEQEKFEIKVTQDLAAAKLQLTGAGRKLLEQTVAQDAALKRTANARAEAKALEEEQQRNQDELSASLAADAREWDRYQVQLLGATQSLKDNSRELEVEGRMINATDKERRIAIESLRIQLELEQKLRELDDNRALGPKDRAEAKAKLEAQAAEATRQAVSRAGIDESREFAGTLREDVKGALTTAFRDSKNVLGSFGDALANVIYTRASSAVADALLGKVGLGAGASGNYFGGLLSMLNGGGGSAAAAAPGLMEELASYGVFHSGGVVGDRPPAERVAHPAMFRNAPRYHTGGIVGDEVPAILQRGEEVLTANDPRHRRNGGGGMSVTFAPVYQVDSRSDRGAILADMQRISAESQKQLVEQLRRQGALG